MSTEMIWSQKVIEAERTDGRYRMSTLFVGPRRGRMRFPLIDTTDATTYIVKGIDVGRLFNVASKVYGDERLWWVLAYANSIANPFDETELYAGRQLLIPTTDAVNEALQGG